MQTIKKYLLLIFLIENIIVQTILLGTYTDIIFYSALALGTLGIIDGTIFKEINFKKFYWAYLLIILYVVYEFIIAPEFISPKTLLYMGAKIMTLIIIITSISDYRLFYSDKALIYIIIFASFFLLYGLITGTGRYEESRDMAGFSNPNTAGSMGAIVIGILIFYMKNRTWNIFYILILLIGFYGVFAGASRAGFLMLFTFIILRYGASIRNYIMLSILAFLSLFLLDSIGVKTIGIQRLLETYEGELGTLRDDEREAALWMINQNPYKGWGYEAKNVGDAETISDLGAHNAYLELTKQMGIPTAIIYLLILVIPMIINIFYSLKFKIPVTLFLALTITLLIKANYESLIVGVHEIETNLFFFALAMISSNNYIIKTKLIL